MTCAFPWGAFPLRSHTWKAGRLRNTVITAPLLDLTHHRPRTAFVCPQTGKLTISPDRANLEPISAANLPPPSLIKFRSTRFATPHANKRMSPFFFLFSSTSPFKPFFLQPFFFKMSTFWMSPFFMMSTLFQPFPFFMMSPFYLFSFLFSFLLHVGRGMAGCHLFLSFWGVIWCWLSDGASVSDCYNSSRWAAGDRASFSSGGCGRAP